MMMTAEQIAKEFETKAEIKKYYLSEDESHLWPINGKFNVTKRAFNRVAKFERESGCAVDGLEYCYMVEQQISEIVNNENNW